MSNDFWAKFGKFTAVLGAILIGLQIWELYNKKREDLKLHIKTGKYEVDANIRAALINNFKAFSYKELKEDLNTKLPELKDNHFKILQWIDKKHNKVWGNVTESNYDNLKNISLLTLTNSGTLAATNIKVDLPVSGFSIIRESGKKPRVSQFDNVISLPDIRPNNTIEITIWTIMPFFKSDYEKINVTHKNGLGNVDWSIEATGMAWFIQKYQGYIFVTLLIIFCFWIQLVGSKSTTESEEKEQAKTNEKEPIKSEVNDKEEPVEITV